MADNIQHAINDATLLLRQQHSGVLSTISVSVTDFPFGSITPFLLNGNGDIVIYASDIAQHAKNIRANSKVSLFIHDASEHDSQASARVTVLGNASADSVSEADQQRYFRLFPQAKAYVDAHDFRFYLIKTLRVRYIGGFGEIYWLPEDFWRKSFVNIDESEVGAIEHMHHDHADALQAIAQFALGSVTPVQQNQSEAQIQEQNQEQSQEPHVEMLSIVHNGMHLKVAEQTIFVPFLTRLTQPDDMRKAVVDITKHARAQLANVN